MNQLITIYLIAALGVMAPGPAFIHVITIALRNKPISGIYASVGLAIGTMLLLATTIIGLNKLLLIYAPAIKVLHFIGGTWLLYLGFCTLMSVWKQKSTFTESYDNNNFSGWRFVFSGFLMQITNPKAAMYWLSAMSLLTIKNMDSIFLITAIFGAAGVAFILYSTVALSFSSVKIRQSWRSHQLYISIAIGGIYSALGLSFYLKACFLNI